MKLLTGAEGMFTAVGDDDQSIYAWRGANMENLRKMQEDYPQMKVIKIGAKLPLHRADSQNRQQSD